MDALLGFHVSGWDYLTFLVIFIIGVAFLALVIFILARPLVAELALPDQFLKQSNVWRCQMSCTASDATTDSKICCRCRQRFLDGNAWHLRSC